MKPYRVCRASIDAVPSPVCCSLRGAEREPSHGLLQYPSRHAWWIGASMAERHRAGSGGGGAQAAGWTAQRMAGSHGCELARPKCCILFMAITIGNSRPMGWKLVLRKPVWGQRVVIDVNRRRRRDPSSYAPMCATEDCPLLSMTDLWCCFWADAGIGRCGGLQGSPWLTVG